jgi:hypothetical protein
VEYRSVDARISPDQARDETMPFMHGLVAMKAASRCCWSVRVRCSFETRLGSQVSVLALAAIALFIHFQSREKFFAAGFCLAVGAYTPTLLLLPAGVLVAGRA